MSSHPNARTHPVRAFARQLTVRLDQLAPTAVWSMSPADQRDTLRELAKAESQLAALRLRVLAEADRSGATDTEAACSAADWLAVQTQQVRRTVRSDLHLARAIQGHTRLAEAMSHGDVNVPQARAITHALDLLPDTGDFAVTYADRAKAEAHLVALAAHHDAKELAILGRKVFEVIAPEVAEEFEGKALADQEVAALRRTMFTMREDDEGTCHGRFRIPTLHGHMLQKFLLAIASPARRINGPDTGPGADSDAVGAGVGVDAASGADGGAPAVSGPEMGIDHALPPSVRHGLAFCQLLEAIPAKDLPTAGGASATVVVTMTLEQLVADLQAHGICDLDTGGQLTAGEARRLACTAGIIPAVLGGKSEPLDLGRRRRFHSPAQRLAMTLRDKGCTAKGCDRPPSMCHAHHDHAWGHGGNTDVATGRLLCGHHHRRIHDPHYEHRIEPSGAVSFHRRT